MNSKQIEQQSDDLAKAEEIVIELSAEEVEEVSGGGKKVKAASSNFGDIALIGVWA